MVMVPSRNANGDTQSEPAEVGSIHGCQCLSVDLLPHMKSTLRGGSTVDGSLSPSEDKLPQQCSWRGLRVPIWTYQGGGLEWEEEEEQKNDVRWRRKRVIQTPASALT